MVASGPRSAIPHANTTDRTIEDGDPVWIDIVVFYEGYVADITRSCFAGKPTKEMRAVYQAVYEAQERGRTLARPGMTGAEIDALCRDHIERAGFGPYFTHRTGHGIGLDVHEEPYIVKSNKIPLAADMAFTVEPGVYLPGKGGVRIEDDVILTESGSRTLTSCPREQAWVE
jgi:Xaa-Pro aminopeptidase